MARRPVAVVIFVGAAATITWAGFFALISASTAARALLAAPDYAIGWFVMRSTTRLRMPLNAAVAAPVSALFPSLSKLKISPLLTAFAHDKETRGALYRARTQLENSSQLNDQARKAVQGSFRGLANFARWAEGPIDRFGLAYYLTARASNVSTLCAATYAAKHGLDVTSFLTSWGFSSELQADAGLFACAAALNVLCVPLHFTWGIGAVQRLENLASRAWHHRHREKLGMHGAHTASSPRDSDPHSRYPSVVQTDAKVSVISPEERARTLSIDKKIAEGGIDVQADAEPTEDDFQKALITNVALVVVCLDMAFGLWIVKRAASSQAKKDIEGAAGSITDNASDGDPNDPELVDDDIDTITAVAKDSSLDDTKLPNDEAVSVVSEGG